MIPVAVGAKGDDAAALLLDAAGEAEKLLGIDFLMFDAYLGYMEWAGNAAQSLQEVFSQQVIDRLITTPRYWALYSAGPANSPDINHIQARAELEQRVPLLRRAGEDLRREASAWRYGRDVAIVLDTNVVADYYDRLGDVDWNMLVNERENVSLVLTIPMKVIDELDNLKDRGPKPEFRGKARGALRLLEESVVDPRRPMELDNRVRPKSSLLLRVLVDEPSHVPLAVADAEILDRASALGPFASKVVVVTHDTGMILRARQLGVTALRPPKVGGGRSTSS